MSEEQASGPSAKMGDEEKPVSGLSGSRRPRWGSGTRVAQRGEREGWRKPGRGAMELWDESGPPLEGNRRFIEQGGALQIVSGSILFLWMRPLSVLLRATQLIRSRDRTRI